MGVDNFIKHLESEQPDPSNEGEAELIQQEDSSGRDEMNLAEFPIALLDSRQRLGGSKTIEFQDTIKGEGGKSITRTWTVTGSEKHGLPVEADEQVYLALMEVTKEDLFQHQEVCFTRYDLLRRMNWPDSGTYYQRIEQSLDRLMGMTVKAKNAWWDNEKKAYVTESFHIIDRYTLYDRGGTGGQASLPLSSMKWNDVVWQSFQSGYVKRLDTRLFFQLETSIARRLYRYLDKKMGRKHAFQIDMFKLCHEHLGMTRKFTYLSQLKRALQPAIQELINIGYLAECEFRPSKENRRSEIVEFVKAKKTPKQKHDDPAAFFYKQLLGVSEVSRTISMEETQLAEQFVRKHGRKAFEEFVSYALNEKKTKWPEMATLTGAFNTFSDPFVARLKRQNETEEKELAEQQKRDREKTLSRAWHDYIDAKMIELKNQHSGIWAEFERSLETDRDYQRLVDDSKRSDGPLAKAAGFRRKDVFCCRFAAFFEEHGVLHFPDWCEENGHDLP